MFALLAAVAFAIGAVLQAVNGPDLGHNPMFWLLTGLAAWALAGCSLPVTVKRGQG